MGAWQGPLANGWHQQPKAVTRRSTANIAQLNQGSPSQTLRQRLRVALCTNGSSQSLPYFHEAYLVAKVIGPTPKPTLTHLNRDIGFWASPVDVRPVGFVVPLAITREPRCLLLALLGPREMSDLSPQSGPKRTLDQGSLPLIAVYEYTS